MKVTLQGLEDKMLLLLVPQWENLTQTQFMNQSLANPLLTC